MITIYTTIHCPYCKMVKRYFIERNINFNEKNVGVDEDALNDMVKKSGQMGVPVIDFGEDIVIGFDREMLDRLINKNKIK